MAGSSSLAEINMGYGGFCGVDWYTSSLLHITQNSVSTNSALANPQQIFITNGNVQLNYNRPTQNTYKAPRDTSAAFPVLFGPGTASISGSIAFDMSHQNLDYFLDSSKLARNTYFHLIMNDGNFTYAVYYNIWNSFTLSASSGGILTCNIGYVSLNCFKDEILKFSGAIPTTINQSSNINNALVSYWQAGTQGYIDSFNINLTQDVNPVYLNNDKIMPSYLRCGSLKLTAQIQSCLSWQNISRVVSLSSYTSGQIVSSFSFQIGSKIFVLNDAVLMSKEYSHAGAGDVAKYSYTIETVALDSPQASLFSFSSVTA